MSRSSIVYVCCWSFWVRLAEDAFAWMRMGFTLPILSRLAHRTIVSVPPYFPNLRGASSPWKGQPRAAAD
ncbi:hypothetical protein SPHINGOT1_270173 [Sphingomonas sp. T1]|nr:hypothetical protein SPHINGOT1_270173 [Sphingomonas sp. T1]